MGFFTWRAVSRTANELRQQRWEREYEAKEQWVAENPGIAEVHRQFKASFVVWPITLCGILVGWLGWFPGIAITGFAVGMWYFWWQSSGEWWLWLWLVTGFFVGVGKVIDMIFHNEHRVP